MHYSRSRIQRALSRFLLGRAATGVLGLLFFVLVLRLLNREEFGAYSALLALQAGVAVIGTLGIEATLERFLPELRTQQDEGAVTRLILLGVLARCGVLLVAAGAAAGTMSIWVPLLSMQDFRHAVPVALLWLVLFGLLSTCSAIHEALLNQGTAQLAQGVYSTLKLALLLTLPLGSLGADGLYRVMVCEAAATAVALLLVLGALWREARVPRLGVRPASGLPAGIKLRMWRFALKNYGAQLLMLMYGADAMRLVASSQAGLAQAARFGAVHSLFEYVQRYLPAFMLVRLIRPVFVSRYTADRDFQALNTMASIVLKLNLMVIVPLVVFLLGAGDLVLGVMSKGRYADAGWLLAAYAALLVPVSHQWVVSVVASTTEQNDTQLKAAALAVPGIFVGAFLITHLGVGALVAGAWCSALIYNVAAILILRRAGFPIRVDWDALKLCALMVGMGGVVVRVSHIVLPVGSAAQAAVSVLAAVACLGGLYVFKLFSAEQMQLLQSLVRRRRPTP